jgi:cyclase
MPFCYGGGIKTSLQAQKIFNLGVEKIAISSAAIENPKIISEISEKVGSQSVVVVLDIKKKTFSSKYELYSYNGTKSSGLDPIEFAVKIQKLGAGEIVINSIDQDGIMKGYDENFISKMMEVIHIPVTVVGGAGKLDDFGRIIHQHGIIGVGAGSLFVFKGKFRAVLINYPTPSEKKELIEKYFLANRNN